MENDVPNKITIPSYLGDYETIDIFIWLKIKYSFDKLEIDIFPNIVGYWNLVFYKLNFVKFDIVMKK